MKNTLVSLFLLFSAPIFAQLTVTEKFQKITTIQQAQQYIDANQELKPTFLNLSLGKDSALIDKRLLRQKQGDVFSVGYVTYKVLESKDTINFRASYIFLDGSTYSKREIDSLKKLIVKRLLQESHSKRSLINTQWMETKPVVILTGFLANLCTLKNSRTQCRIISSGKFSF